MPARFDLPVVKLPNPNAATIWEQAAKFADKDHISSRTSSVGEPPALSLSERMAVLAKSRLALEWLRIGLRYPCVQPPVRSLEPETSTLAGMGRLAHLVRFEAETYALAGKPHRAMQSVLEGLEFGERVRTGSSIIGLHVGLACSNIARAEAWELLDSLNEGTARAAAARLERIDAVRQPLEAFLREDMNVCLAGLREIMEKPEWRMRLWTYFLHPKEELDSPKPKLKPLQALWLLRYTKRGIVEAYTREMQQEITRLRQYPAVPLAPPTIQDPLLAALIPDLLTITFYYHLAVTQDRLLLTACALRAYSRKHGSVPGSLHQLVPGYLSRLPADPFLPQTTPLRYKRLANGRYLLYSVGPDQIDDGGVPIAREAETPGRPKGRVQPNSRGDIVAGINRW